MKTLINVGFFFAFILPVDLYVVQSIIQYATTARTLVLQRFIEQQIQHL